MKRLFLIFLSLFLMVSVVSGCLETGAPKEHTSISSVTTESSSSEEDKTGEENHTDEIPLRASFETIDVEMNGKYTSMEEVASYIFQYDMLPSNYITKAEARKLGWKPSDGNLWKVTDQMSIGGDVFGNREGKLPTQEGRIYYECDIDYEGGNRNAKRIVYSNDGLIFYTEDHYKTFERLECT